MHLPLQTYTNTHIPVLGHIHCDESSQQSSPPVSNPSSRLQGWDHFTMLASVHLCHGNHGMHSLAPIIIHFGQALHGLSCPANSLVVGSQVGSRHMTKQLLQVQMYFVSS